MLISDTKLIRLASEREENLKLLIAFAQQKSQRVRNVAAWGTGQGWGHGQTASAILKSGTIWQEYSGRIP
jgi:hypothetical protein